MQGIIRILSNPKNTQESLAYLRHPRNPLGILWNPFGILEESQEYLRKPTLRNPMEYLGILVKPQESLEWITLGIRGMPQESQNTKGILGILRIHRNLWQTFGTLRLKNPWHTLRIPLNALGILGIPQESQEDLRKPRNTFGIRRIPQEPQGILRNPSDNLGIPGNTQESEEYPGGLPEKSEEYLRNLTTTKGILVILRKLSNPKHTQESLPYPWNLRNSLGVLGMPSESDECLSNPRNTQESEPRLRNPRNPKNSLGVLGIPSESDE